jgi:hypothetical protein
VAWLVAGGRLRRWTPAGYTDTRPLGRAVLVTPPTLVDVLRAGWSSTAIPLLHPSAQKVSDTFKVSDTS